MSTLDPQPLPDGAPDGLRFFQVFTEQEQAALVAHIEALAFTHDKFRGRQMRRGYAQFGQAYVTQGRALRPVPPMPPWLRGAMTRGAEAAGLAPDFEQAIITRYPKGAGIGWHTDAPVFGPTVLTLSLSSVGRMQFRRGKGDDQPVTLPLPPGSVLVIARGARRDWQHQIVKVKALRHSITFRHIA